MPAPLLKGAGIVVTPRSVTKEDVPSSVEILGLWGQITPSRWADLG